MNVSPRIQSGAFEVEFYRESGFLLVPGNYSGEITTATPEGLWNFSDWKQGSGRTLGYMLLWKLLAIW